MIRSKAVTYIKGQLLLSSLPGTDPSLELRSLSPTEKPNHRPRTAADVLGKWLLSFFFLCKNNCDTRNPLALCPFVQISAPPRGECVFASNYPNLCPRCTAGGKTGRQELPQTLPTLSAVTQLLLLPSFHKGNGVLQLQAEKGGRTVILNGALGCNSTFAHQKMLLFHRRLYSFRF